MANCALPDRWEQVVGRIDLVLERAVAAAAERQKGLEAGDARPRATAGTAWDKQVAGLDRCLANFESCWRSAAEKAVELQGALGMAEAFVAQWLEHADSVRQRLANWRAASVS
jgi:hypothetical protein